MPIDVSDMATTKITHCCNCDKLIKSENSYECELLQDTAFNMIPNSTVENNGVFADCPKLDGTMYEKTRYYKFK